MTNRLTSALFAVLAIASLGVLSGCADSEYIALQAANQDCFTGHDGGWTCFWAAEEATVIERRYCYQELGGITCYMEPQNRPGVQPVGTSGY